jgi:hypothetical protein
MKYQSQDSCATTSPGKHEPIALGSFHLRAGKAKRRSASEDTRAHPRAEGMFQPVERSFDNQ